MWCPTCQLDVASPTIADASARLRCERCGNELATTEQETTKSKAAPAVKPYLIDDWELDADLRGVERLIGSIKASGLPTAAPVVDVSGHSPPHRASRAQLHEAHERVSGWHADPNSKPPKSNPLAWTVLSLGLATFACGAVLLGWSCIAERDDLWPLGLPLALVGQAALIIGLVLQLEGLWHSNRQTAETLSDLDDELNRVRHATTLLTTTKNAHAQSFYAHMAEGASPQLLLADLKGQLDLLAQQMASQRR